MSLAQPLPPQAGAPLHHAAPLVERGCYGGCGTETFHKWQFLQAYFNAHMLSYPSHRYAYLLLIVFGCFALLVALAHHVGLGDTTYLGALWSKWATKDRTIELGSKSRASSAAAANAALANDPSRRRGSVVLGSLGLVKANGRPRRVLTLPSAGRQLMITAVLVVLAVMVFVGADYINPNAAMFDMRESFPNATEKAAFVQTGGTIVTGSIFRRRAGIDLFHDDGSSPSPLTAAMLSKRVQYGVGDYPAIRTAPASMTIPYRTWWTIGGRLGLLTNALTPFVVVLALKQVPFALLSTRLMGSYAFERLSYLHKWGGRIIWLLATAHVATWSVQLALDNRFGVRIWTFVFYWTRFRWGFVSYIFLTLLVVFSLAPMRITAYETFYVLHVVCVLGFMITAALHHPPLGGWMWATLLWWLLERITKTVRLAWVNGIGFAGRKPQQLQMTAPAKKSRTSAAKRSANAYGSAPWSGAGPGAHNQLTGRPALMVSEPSYGGSVGGDSTASSATLYNQAQPGAPSEKFGKAPSSVASPPPYTSPLPPASTDHQHQHSQYHHDPSHATTQHSYPPAANFRYHMQQSQAGGDHQTDSSHDSQESLLRRKTRMSLRYDPVCEVIEGYSSADGGGGDDGPGGRGGRPVAMGPRRPTDQGEAHAHQRPGAVPPDSMPRYALEDAGSGGVAGAHPAAAPWAQSGGHASGSEGADAGWLSSASQYASPNGRPRHRIEPSPSISTLHSVAGSQAPTLLATHPGLMPGREAALLPHSLSSRSAAAASAFGSDAAALLRPGYAFVQLLPGKTLRLTLRTPNRTSWKPGQWVNLSVPAVRWWESHPFTVASACDAGLDGMGGAGAAVTTASQPLRARDEELGLVVPDDGADAAQRRGEERTMVLLVRVRNGFTRHLWNHVVIERQRQLDALAAQHQVGAGSVGAPPELSKAATGVHIRALVDGPYGATARVRWHIHDTVVIICGGSGVSFGMAALEHLCSHLAGLRRRAGGGGDNPHGEAEPSGNGKRWRGFTGMRTDSGEEFRVRRVRFVWMLREFSHLQWVAVALRRCVQLVPPEVLQVDLYVTHYNNAAAFGGGVGAAGAVDPLRTPRLGTPGLGGGGGSASDVKEWDSVVANSQQTLFPPTQTPWGQRSGAGGVIASAGSSPLATPLPGLNAGPGWGRRADDANAGAGGGRRHAASSATAEALSQAARVTEGPEQDEYDVSAVDLTQFDGEEYSEPTAAEMEINERIRKEGKLRRAQTRKATMKRKGGGAAKRNAALAAREQSDAEDGVAETMDTMFARGVARLAPSRRGERAGGEAGTSPSPRPELLGVPPQQGLAPPPSMSQLSAGGGGAMGVGDESPNLDGYLSPSVLSPPGSPRGRTAPLPPRAGGAYAQGLTGMAGLEPVKSEAEATAAAAASGATTPKEELDSFNAPIDLDPEEDSALSAVAELARPGHPKLDRVVREEARRAKGRVLVASCGPASLGQLLRSVVSKQIEPARVRRGELQAHINLQVESFDWGS